ncbi:peptide-N(4)-(N-acetyl-beta-glucosaminyl)asparagine amidase [Biomphalaria glabrata]|nr:peptide-N(4)-(N-acetyl-beta-glucosaminyl)asparagine amidase-like; partial [Biomphalaria glabrata]
MAPTADSISQMVNENSVDNFMTASNILIKFAVNILENPTESKYRRIRISNPTIQNKLLNVSGGMECLFEMGFQEAEDGECLVFPSNASLQILETIKNNLHKQREKLQRKMQPTSFVSRNSQRVEEAGASASTSQTLVTVSRPASSYLVSEAEFLTRMEDGLRRVKRYENQALQQKVRDIIPVNQLEVNAKQRYDTRSRAQSTWQMKDFLLLSLLNWFKTSFFKWVDTLPCERCHGSTQNTGYLTPTPDDLQWGARRVESHLCSSCNHVNRFPRYTDAEKLLTSRCGRCGEWADCFTLCCRSLDFEARYVMDWTDHVWTEVYSNSQSRWLHCDACENVCDKPLLYESGWGKKLTYVIAFSKDEIQDVTWRYSAKHNEILARRTLCRESWLRRAVHQLWKREISRLSQERQQELLQRLICELTEFITKKNDTAEALPGRTTGSVAWREARGELGASASQQSQVQNNFVFIPTEAERECEMIHIVYNCATDKYVRLSSGNQEYEGWQTCVFTNQDIFRKEEYDWKMVYLTRHEESAYGEIVWKFDITGTDLRISKVEFKAESAVFETGAVNWRICAGEMCFMHTGSSLQNMITIDVHGCQTLTVTAVLQGGQGQNAWQHAQLFRQSLENTGGTPLDLKLFLN